MSISLGVLAVSSCLDSGCAFSARISQTGCSVLLIASSQVVYDFDLFLLYWWCSFDHLIEDLRVRLLHCKATLFPFVMKNILWEVL